MSMKLRDLIRLVRNCKTAAEERSIITKESAHIRASFKEDENHYRQRNVAKLLFIHMLGYPSQFGQVECLKLISSNKFSEKRIGYLALSQLLDNDSEILLLATNSIKNDLNNSNQYVNGLALSCISNNAPKEMCRSVIREISELIKLNNPFIKKRSLMAAVNIIRQLDDLNIDIFINCIPTLLDDKNHSVLLGTCHLINSICSYYPNYKNKLNHYINTIIKILKNINMAGYQHSLEYENNGIIDQFLNVYLLRVLGNVTNDDINFENIKDELSSTLAQIMTNTDHTKNGGNSILFECVITMCKLSNHLNEDGLHILGMNIITRFLQNNDTNIRFVALKLLEILTEHGIKTSLLISEENYATHNNLIIQCLKESDISIKYRALKAVFSIINDQNIKYFIKELLNILLLSSKDGEVDFCIELATGLCIVCKNSNVDDIKWYVDTYIKLFCLAGNYINENEKDSFIGYVTTLDINNQKYTTLKLYYSLSNHLDQLLLIQVSVWCLGEYGNLILDHDQITKQSIIKIIYEILKENIKELSEYTTSLSLYNNSCNAHHCLTSKENIGYTNLAINLESNILFSLTSLMKLASKFSSDKNKIIDIFDEIINNNHLQNVEILQRIHEYRQLLDINWDNDRNQIFANIPKYEFNYGNINDVNKLSNTKKGDTIKEEQDNLLDLDIINNNDNIEVQNNSIESDINIKNLINGRNYEENTLLIDDLLQLDNKPIKKPEKPTLIVANKSEIVTDPFELLIDSTQNQFNEKNKVSLKTDKINIYDNNHVQILFKLSKINEQIVNIVAEYHNLSNLTISKFKFEIALPKYLSVELKPATSNDILQNEHIEQQITINRNEDSTNKQIIMKIRISYIYDNKEIVESCNVKNIPSYY